MNIKIKSLIIIITLLTIQALAFAADLNNINVNFNKSNQTFDISHNKIGTILYDIVISYTDQGKSFSTKDKKLSLKLSSEQKHINLKIDNNHSISINTGNTGNIYLIFNGKADGLVTLQAKTNYNSDTAISAILKNQKHTDNHILTTTLGPAEIQDQQNNTFVQTKYMNWPVYGCQKIGPEKSIFLPQDDLAITATASRYVKWFYNETWNLKTKANPAENLLILKLNDNYYRDTLDIQYYAPLKKRGIWKTAPIVAMTWYGASEEKKDNIRQNKEWLYPQIDWVAQNLLPYAENLVFQLDADYRFKDDKYMREISDYIRSKGLIPGIWLTPFSVAPMETYNQHPEWFLHGSDGKPFTGFGIHPSWNWPKEERKKYQWWENGPGILNVTNDQAVEQWFAKHWKKVSEKWNYDFFKIDGLPMAAQVYEKAVNGRGIDGFRKGLEIGRKIAGDKFINACWGTEIDAIGLVDGARTGPDTGTFPHAMEYLIRWNYLNNIAWYCDPDAAANQHKASIESVRLNAQARVLTGQQFLTDDVWTKKSKPICKAWQQSSPMLNIKPANLYQIENYKDYDIFDLRIAKPWKTWDVVGLFNYDEKPCKKTLLLSKLQLLSDKVHVFEFWSNTYLGLFDKNAKIERDLKSYQGQTFSIVPDTPDKPVLLSTSRHLTAGALDLKNIEWKKDNNKWIIKGNSQHLIIGDTYQIVFAHKNFKITDTKSSMQTTEIKTDKNITSVTFIPTKNTKEKWQITFGKK